MLKEPFHVRSFSAGSSIRSDPWEGHEWHWGILFQLVHTHQLGGVRRGLEGKVPFCSCIQISMNLNSPFHYTIPLYNSTIHFVTHSDGPHKLATIPGRTSLKAGEGGYHNTSTSAVMSYLDPDTKDWAIGYSVQFPMMKGYY